MAAAIRFPSAYKPGLNGSVIDYMINKAYICLGGAIFRHIKLARSAEAILGIGADDPTVTHGWSEFPSLPPRAGKYRIVGRIGHGGMGVVYRGVDDDLGRSVALKFVPGELSSNPTAEQRFLREARAASALDHVNIGTIFGVEETEDHRRFIVMAYYEGHNLSQRMKDDAHPLAPDEAIGIAVQVARGLAEAHAQGVIHRDIKPSNILLTSQGVVKIVDFGLASMADTEQLTQTGARMGTPAYMSPEQAQGEAVDQRSDIWSLGVVICEMITRKSLFQSGSVPAILYQVVHGEVSALDLLQPDLREVLEKALSKDPEKRYPSMKEFLAALESLRPGTAAPLAEPVRRWKPRIRLVPALLVTLLVILAGAVGAFLWRDKWLGARHPGIAGAPASATVFDKYVQAVDLTKRWDKEGNLEKAIALLTEATKQDPTFALGFARLAEAQRIRSQLTRDKALLETASANAERAVNLNGDLAPVQVVFGRIQTARGNRDLALASFEHALRIDPNDAEANQAIARQYQQLGRVTDAEASYLRAVSLDPDSIFIHDSFANFLFNQGRYRDAVREWQIVVRLAPDNAAAYINLGSALSELGEIAEAVTMFQQAVGLKPNYMAYNNLGTAFSRAMRYPEAAETYRKALALDGKDPMVWGNLAYVYSWMNGKDEEARKMFAQAIELGEAKRKERPSDASVASYLALYYAKTGQQQLALSRLGTALALSPKGSEIQAAAAEVYELLGRRAKALEFARKALALGYPKNRLERNPELAKLLQSM
jgi:tetratricopeptide (TPR) repeat protein